MIFITRLALVVCAAAVCLSAQAPAVKGVPATRLYSGTDGETHAEVVSLSELTGKGGARQELLQADGVRFATRGPGTSDDWHVTPRRQYLVTLQGEVDIEIGGGRKVHAGPGSILLIEDLTGKGHRATVTGKDEWHVLFIPVAEKK